MTNDSSQDGHDPHFNPEVRLALLERTVVDHDRTMIVLGRQVEGLRISITHLAASVRAKEAVDQALHAAVKENTNKQLTARQLYLGILGFLVAFGGMMGGIVSSIH